MGQITIFSWLLGLSPLQASPLIFLSMDPAPRLGAKAEGTYLNWLSSDFSAVNLFRSDGCRKNSSRSSFPVRHLIMYWLFVFPHIDGPYSLQCALFINHRFPSHRIWRLGDIFFFEAIPLTAWHMTPCTMHKPPSIVHHRLVFSLARYRCVPSYLRQAIQWSSCHEAARKLVQGKLYPWPTIHLPPMYSQPSISSWDRTVQISCMPCRWLVLPRHLSTRVITLFVCPLFNSCKVKS